MDGKGRALDNQRIERFFDPTNGKSFILKIAKQDISSGRLQGNMWSIITTGGLTSRWITKHRQSITSGVVSSFRQSYKTLGLCPKPRPRRKAAGLS